jgi:hypothetical protein
MPPQPPQLSKALCELLVSLAFPTIAVAKGQDVPEIRKEAGINDFYRIKETG